MDELDLALTIPTKVSAAPSTVIRAVVVMGRTYTERMLWTPDSVSLFTISAYPPRAPPKARRRQLANTPITSST